jgi:hypothetical protein
MHRPGQPTIPNTLFCLRHALAFGQITTAMRTSLVYMFLLAAVPATAQNEFDARFLSYEGLQYPCDGSVTPRVKIQNVGNQTMATCVVETWKNGLLQNSFNWVLATAALSGDIRQPSLPAISVQEGDALEFRIISVNDVPDQGVEGNLLDLALTGPVEACALQTVEVQVVTDAAPEETAWTLRTAAGQVLAQGGPFSGPGTHSAWVTLPADACLALDVTDAGGNGIDGGRVTVRCAGADLFQVEGTSFGTRATAGLRTGSVVGVSEPVVAGSLRLMPNPASGHVRLDLGSVAGRAEVVVRDATGRIVLAKVFSSVASPLDVDLAACAPGLHVVHVLHAGGTFAERLIVD